MKKIIMKNREILLSKKNTMKAKKMITSSYQTKILNKSIKNKISKNLKMKKKMMISMKMISRMMRINNLIKAMINDLFDL